MPLIRNSKGETALQTAIKHKYVSVIKLIVSDNVTLPPSLQQRMPPKQVRFLIRNGADVHATPSEGETIPHLAITNYDGSACLELVKSFVEAGSDATICNSEGETALHTAIKHR